MKGLVILFLAVLVVGSFAQRPELRRKRPIRRYTILRAQKGDKIYASSLGGAPVGIYSRTPKQPAFIRGIYPIYFPKPSRAAGYGGVIVGPHSQRRRLVLPRLPVFRKHVHSQYAVSLGGAPVGIYRRKSKGGRRRGSGIYGVSLGKAPVGGYSRE